MPQPAHPAAVNGLTLAQAEAIADAALAKGREIGLLPLCVVVLVMEVRYGWPTNWVCKSFWLSSGVVATLLLWSNLEDVSRAPSH